MMRTALDKTHPSNRTGKAIMGKNAISRLCLTARTCCSGLIMLLLALGGMLAIGPLRRTLQAQGGPIVVRSKPMPAGESPGQRPYEMVRANRRPERAPLVDFDSLEGWTLEPEGDAEGELYGSQRQRVWESPVARLVYRGTSAQSAVTIRPSKPIPIPDPVSAVTIWIYGNNWSWESDPTTPRVTVSLLLRDRNGAHRDFDIVRQLGWKEWWLVYGVVPKEILENAPLHFAGIRVSGCANGDNRELFFEDLAFFQETFPPLSFAPRPKRGCGGQSWSRPPFVSCASRNHSPGEPCFFFQDKAHSHRQRSASLGIRL
jgi:hypothetical protein